VRRREALLRKDNGLRQNVRSSPSVFFPPAERLGRRRDSSIKRKEWAGVPPEACALTAVCFLGFHAGQREGEPCFMGKWSASNRPFHARRCALPFPAFKRVLDTLPNESGKSTAPATALRQDKCLRVNLSKPDIRFLLPGKDVDIAASKTRHVAFYGHPSLSIRPHRSQRQKPASYHESFYTHTPERRRRTYFRIQAGSYGAPTLRMKQRP